MAKITIPEIKFEAITEPYAKEIISRLLGLIDSALEGWDKDKAKLQQVIDKCRELKGEKGKPNIKPKTRGNYSSKTDQEKAEGKKKKPRKKRRKKNKKITQTKRIPIDKSTLPADAVYKGTVNTVLTGITIRVEGIELKREKYYSRSKKKTYVAPLPAGCTRDYDVSVQSMILVLNKVLQTSQSGIQQFFESLGLNISASQISNIITTANLDMLKNEQYAIMEAGLQSRRYIQTDDTMARVKGQNCHTHIFGNDYFSAYFTEEKKDRITVLDCLRLKQDREYVLNEDSLGLLKYWNLPKVRIRQLDVFERDRIYSEAEFKLLLRAIYQKPNKYEVYQSRIREAMYIAAYHLEEICMLALVSDDAPQFRFLAYFHALCWVHEARHYNKLMPSVEFHKSQLKRFLTQFWNLYSLLHNYKDIPSPQLKLAIETDFDKLCNFKTTYPDLKKRIAKTKANKLYLLYVLDDPTVPLHNNDSELAARRKVRSRDIHLHTMSPEGTEADDALLTIIATTKKLGVNIYNYIHDRISRSFELPSLADLILERKSQRIQEEQAIYQSYLPSTLN